MSERSAVYSMKMRWCKLRSTLDNGVEMMRLFKPCWENQKTLFSFDFLDWTRGDRSKELELEVLTEYYVTDMFSLVGNVGGQLGLFVSFSFIGCFGWLMNHSKMLSLVSYFCSWFRTKDTAEPRWLLKLMQCWFLLIL